MPELLTAPDVEELMSDLAVSSLDVTVASDAHHDEELDFRLDGGGAGRTCVCACDGMPDCTCW